MKKKQWRKKHTNKNVLNFLQHHQSCPETVNPDPFSKFEWVLVFVPHMSVLNGHHFWFFAFLVRHYPLNHGQCINWERPDFHFQPNTSENCQRPPPMICNWTAPIKRALWSDAIAANVLNPTAFDVYQHARKISICKCIYLCFCAIEGENVGKKPEKEKDRERKHRSVQRIWDSFDLVIQFIELTRDMY